MATYWENSCSFGLRYVSWYEYLIVSLVFSHLGFWSGNLFLIAPFPDLCLLVPFYRVSMAQVSMLSNEWLSRYGLLENFNKRIAIFEGVLDFNLQPHPLAWTTGYLWSKYECFLMSGCQGMDF